MNQFESLIADFAKMTGLPLSPDARGGCALQADGIFITLQYRAEAGDVAVFAPVADGGRGGDAAAGAAAVSPQFLHV